MQDIYKYSNQAVVKAGFGPFHKAMGDILKNSGAKGLLSWRFGEAEEKEPSINFKSFKEGSFAERCCILGDAILSGVFDERQQEDLFKLSKFPSLSERCVKDKTQVGNLLKAMGNLSLLGKDVSIPSVPSPLNCMPEVQDLSVSPSQGFNCNLALNPTITVELNHYSFLVDPAQMIAHWENVVAQVMECLSAVHMDNVQPACLQVLKILRADFTECTATIKLYASLVFCDTVVKEYPQFGFLNPETAQDFAVHFVKMLRPDLGDFVDWKVISNSLNLQTFDGFLQFYNNCADIARKQEEERLASSPQAQRVSSPPATPVQAVAQQA